MTLVKNKSKQQQMWQNKTVLADEPEDKRPELAPIAMLFTIINAVLCLFSLLLAFVPVLGAYNAFRLTCDDFSWAALFGGTTFIAWVDAVGIEHPIVTGCAVCNFIMWWAYALMTAHVYRTSYFFGMIYGVFPWLGAIIFGFGPNMEYYEPVSLLPEDQQRAKKQEQKEERKKINAATSRAANSRPSNKKRKK